MASLTSDMPDPRRAVDELRVKLLASIFLSVLGDFVRTRSASLVRELLSSLARPASVLLIYLVFSNHRIADPDKCNRNDKAPWAARRARPNCRQHGEISPLTIVCIVASLDHGSYIHFCSVAGLSSAA